MSAGHGRSVASAVMVGVGTGTGIASFTEAMGVDPQWYWRIWVFTAVWFTGIAYLTFTRRSS